MSTFAQMVSRVQSLVGNHTLATTAQIGTIVNDAHRELLEGHEWARKKSEIVISTIPDKTAGTVTLTNNSSALAGSGTAWASTDTGKYILISDSLFVFEYIGAASGTLKDLKGNTITFQGTTTAGLSYVMFKRWYSLGTAIESILSVSIDVPIRERDQEYLDAIDPLRENTASKPLCFARGPYDQASGADLARIEFYPRPADSIDIRVAALLGHTDLSGTTQPIVPASSVQWSAARDACYFLHAKTKEQKWAIAAAAYHKQFMENFDNDKRMDAKHFGLSPAVKDAGGGMGLGNTDFGIYRDTGSL